MDIIEVSFTMLTTLPMQFATVFYAFAAIAGQFVADMLITFGTIYW